MKIGIFYIATSVYKKYFENFCKTMHNLFPKDNKELIILSDGLKEYDEQEINNIKIHVEEIIDLPYPLINLNKFQIVSFYANKYNIEYVLYIDADTICFEKNEYVWNNIKLEIINNNLLLSRHPHYLYNPNREFYEPFIVSNKQSSAYMDPLYINTNKCYIITSFFCGKYDIVNEYAEKLKRLIGHDLNNRSFCFLVDETYMNKLYVDENIINNKQTIILKNYITLNPYIYGDYPNRLNGNIYENNFPEYEDTILFNQKYDISIKDNKKNNYE